MTQFNDIKAQAYAMRDELIARRRDFHQHPETAFEEFRTAGIVAQELTKLGLEVQTGVGKTGVVAVLEGDQDGPTVLVRADMDALPIQEENTFEYISTNAHKMHACGHDGHTAIGLAVAKILSQQRDQIVGRIKFVFQPAEEIGQGARAMIADGALSDLRPDVTLGLHLWNSMPLGTLGVADGSVMAGATNFAIKITGKGSHAASPHLGVDPIVCAAQMVTAFQTLVSRNVDPMETAVVTVGKIVAGDAHNIIPQTAELRGTIRTFKNEVRDLVVARMSEICEHLSQAMGCTSELEISHMTIPVINDPTVANRTRNVFKVVEPSLNLDLNARTMGSEDVSEFMDDIPGMYFFVGAKDTTQDALYGHHHPKFSFDEDALPLSVALLTSAVASYVLPSAAASSEA
jgi:amidohydrolase